MYIFKNLKKYNKIINKEDNSDNYKIKNIVKNNNTINNTYYLYILRIIYYYAVVLIHTSSYYLINLSINSFDWKIVFFYIGISRFSVPTFFMISGALFLNRHIPFIIILNKYIKRIFIRSFIYSISNVTLTNLNIKIIIIEFINSHYHLWYLFAIIGLYMKVPLLKEITKKNELFKVYLILSFIFTFIIPNFIEFLSHYSQVISNLFNTFFSKLNINILTVNTFYFMLGYYLNNKNGIAIHKTIFIYIFGLFGIYFTTKISYDISIKNNKNINYFHFKYLNIFTYSTSIFIFIKNHFNNKNNNKKKTNLIKNISDNTFGIYLIHPLIIEKLEKYKFNELISSIKIIYRIPLASTFIFLSSLLISFIIKYIPFIGKYLI